MNVVSLVKASKRKATHQRDNWKAKALALERELSEMTSQRDAYKKESDARNEACSIALTELHWAVTEHKVPWEYPAQAFREITEAFDELRTRRGETVAMCDQLIRELAEARACLREAMDAAGSLDPSEFTPPEQWARWEAASGRGEGK
jgi:hypothetical protein